MNMPAFSNRPCKPEVTRLPDGRIGVFMGGAYQFTDNAGATSLRDKLNAVLPAPSARELYEQADREFISMLEKELADSPAAPRHPPAVDA